MKYLTQSEIQEALNRGAILHKSPGHDARVYLTIDKNTYVPPVGKVKPSTLSKLIESKSVVDVKVPEVFRFSAFDACYAV